MIACLSAVFAMRQDVNTTLSFGTSRIVGNLIGGLLGIIYFLLAKEFNHAFIFDLFAIPFLVMILIVLADAFKINTGIIGACATLLMIIFTINENHSFIYALDRVLDTIIGTIIAIITNHFVLPYRDTPVETEETPSCLGSANDTQDLPKLEALVDQQAKEIAALRATLEKTEETTTKKD